MTPVLVQTRKITADELLTMPGGDRFELVDGELLEKQMGAKAEHVVANVIIELGLYARQQGGYIFASNAQYRIFEDDPERVRKPDASYVAPGRFPGDEVPEGLLEIPPDLAVEVVSPTDMYYEVETKVHKYLTAGTRQVWVINPETQDVRVFQPGRRPQQLAADDELTGGDVLPGFMVRVGDLFGGSGARV